MAPKKIVIVGTGALGGLYASRFAKATNSQVYTICRSNYKQVKDNGFQIESALYGNYVFKPKEVFSSIDEAGNSGITFDFVVVTMKNVLGSDKIAQLINPVVTNNSIIVLIQNGIEIEEPYIELYPNNPLISCISRIAVTQTESGKLVHKGHSYIGMGLYPKPKTDQQSQAIYDFSAILKETSVPYDVVPDIVCLRFHKLQWNGSFSPISILTGLCTTSQMQQEPEVDQLIRETMIEIRALSEVVLGYPQPSWVLYPNIDDYMNPTRNISYKPSLLVDYERKCPLELEATLGNLVRMAKKNNFAAPLLNAFYALLKLADKKNRGVLELVE